MQTNDTVIQDIARQVVELGGLPDEVAIRGIVDENLKPIREELDALRERKMRFEGNRDAREAALDGTRFAGMYDLATERHWTADDVEFMHDILESARVVGRSRGPSEKLRNLHQAINTRAMDTAESGYGAEIVGVQYVSELWRAAHQASVVFGRIPTFEMNAPSAYLPVAGALPEMLYVSESTSASASDYTTTKTGSNRVLVSAAKFVIHQMWSGEMEEDSIIPFVPFLRQQAAWCLGYYTDSAVLNGDTTNAATGNINLDDADPADTKHYLAFDGLRHACIVDNTNNASNQAAAVSYNALVRLKGLMLDRTYFVDWGGPANPQDVMFVTSPEIAEDIALLDETLTVDKYGPSAMVVTGEVTKVGRNPVVSTIAMSLTEADGKVSDTPANNTKGAVLAFNRNAFVVGWRRRVKVETERLPATDQDRIVYSLRLGFGRYTPTGAASGIEAATLMYNITT